MRKQLISFAVVLCMVVAFAGCSSPQPEVVESPYSQYVQLGEYKGITITEQPIAPVTDETVETYIASVMEGYGVADQILDRAIEVGDTVNIDYRGLLNDIDFEGGTAEAQSLTIGSGQFIEGFEDALVGVMPGEQVDLDLKFPEEYGSEELAGQAVIFEVTVNYIYGDMIVPPLNDDWVKGNTDFQTAEDFRANIKDQMQKEYEQNVLFSRRNSLMDAVVSNTTVNSRPQELVDKEVEEQLIMYTEYASENGMEIEMFLEMNGMTREEFELELRSYAEDYVNEMMIFSEIANKEDITISAEELETRAKEYGFESLQELVDMYGEQKANEVLLRDKVVDYLVEQANYVIGEASASSSQPAADSTTDTSPTPDTTEN